MSTVLVIDDKQDNLVAVTALLKNLKPDCRVITALSGEEGITKAEQELPDVILLDVKMPGMDGFEVCQKLKSMGKTRHIPVILLTAIKTDVESRVRGLEIGADAFLTKPIDELELVAQINVMLRIKRAEDLLRNEKLVLEDLVFERTKSLAESEARLKKERDFLKNLEDASPAYFVAISPEETIITMNRSFLEAIGYTLDEVKGKDYFNFIAKSDVFQTRNAYELIANGGNAVIENTVLTKSGKEISVEWHSRALRKENGELDFIFSVGIDTTERKRLERVIFTRIEEERHAISQNLHEKIGTYLSQIAFKSEILKLKLKGRSPEESKEVEDIAQMIYTAIDRTRELAKSLCPIDMDSGGLRAALEDFRIEIEEKNNCTFIVQWEEGIEIENDLVASNIFYIIKEAVDNALMHGKANNILVSVSKKEGILLRIDDDGKGMPKQQPSEGLGIKIMRYRAWLVGAALEITTNAAGGVSVICLLSEEAARGQLHKQVSEIVATYSKETQVFVIEPIAIVREGLISIIGKDSRFCVCGEAKNSDEAVRCISRIPVDIVIIDIALEEFGGIDLIKALKSRYPSLEIIVVTDADDVAFVERSFRAGASGYILKSEADTKLIFAMQAVLSGKQFLSERLKEELIAKLSRDENTCNDVDKLSNREFEIFQLIGRGLGNRDIAEKMKISVKTVENYRERIKNKLGLENSAKLVRYAVQWMLKRG
ncbi:MAG: response regulator [Spirochaetes bacterium]|nr:response regulator [Spirochaetota bacterium]